jgi:hypothetical protein
MHPPLSKSCTFKYPSFKKYPKNFGPTYIFECPICGKRFKRSKYDSTLRPHKDKNGICVWVGMDIMLKPNIKNMGVNLTLKANLPYYFSSND